MSGLAKLMLYNGAIVTGSDCGSGKEIEILKSLGVNVFPTHNSDNISKNLDIIIYSGAIKPNNPEIVRAKELNIPLIERSEFLGEISRQYKKVIAISGTHGKTTTTAMLGLIATCAGLKPTIHLGGESVNLHGNTIIGGNEYFIVEACEYRESFKYLEPYIGVITNVEHDHVDFYPTFESFRLAFARFAGNCDNLIAPVDVNIPHNHLISIGSDWQVKNIEAYGGGYNFNAYYKREFYNSFRLNCIGLHNVTNALFAISVAHELGINKDVICDALSDFMGVERRYEKIASIGECNIIIDYAHHPTELRNSIDGIKGVYNKILYIFQPHTYSRTLKLFDDFIDVLSPLKDMVLFKTYPAREEVLIGGRAEDLFNALKSPNKEYFDDIDNLMTYIKENAHKFDCILILGAGDLADKLKSYMKHSDKI